MNEKVRAKALDSLDRMAEIVRAEMLETGFYVDPEITRPSRVNAPCGGRKVCAIGALYAAYGAPYKDLLNEASPTSRTSYMRNRPALRAAYEALNEGARRLAQRRRVWLPDRSLDGDLENLFEVEWNATLDRRSLLGVISSAKRRIKAA